MTSYFQSSKESSSLERLAICKICSSGQSKIHILELNQVQNQTEFTRVCVIEVPSNQTVADILLTHQGRLVVASKNRNNHLCVIEELDESSLVWQKVESQGHQHLNLEIIVQNSGLLSSQFLVSKVMASSELPKNQSSKVFGNLKANSRGFLSVIDGSVFKVFE